MTHRRIHRGKYRVATWADGHGRWYAAVSGEAPDPLRLAREAIRRELKQRNDLPRNYRIRLEPAPDEWLTTDRALRPVYREKW